MSFQPHSAAALLIFSAAACLPLCSQTLPATNPTAAPPAYQPPAPPAQQAPARAAVSLTSGQLSVHADNSSLNQILRDISRLTGLRITGGVVDERVFGTYGPAPTGTILATLLNGTGSNMLLVEDGGSNPRQLVLTPRQGGPTPPNPNATRELGETDLPPGLTHRSTNDDPQGVPFPPPTPRANPFNRPLAPGAQSVTNTAAPTPASTDATPPATTSEQAPNGVKTPQQIYEQLLKLQQQQDKTTPPQP